MSHRLLAPAALCLLGLLATTTPAAAGTLEGFAMDYPDRSEVRYVSNPGEANEVFVDGVVGDCGEGCETWTVTITDGAAAHDEGDLDDSCTQPAPGTVTCTFSPAPRLKVRSLDLDDVITAAAGFEHPRAILPATPTHGARALELRGGDGDDLLVGSDGPDYLLGGFGNDTLRGRDGDDIESGSQGNDTHDQGALPDGADQFIHDRYGNEDWIDYSARTAPIVFGQRNDGTTAPGGEGDVPVGATTGWLIGVIGTPYDDVIQAVGPLQAGAGDDEIHTTTARRDIDGGAGFDSLQIDLQYARVELDGPMRQLESVECHGCSTLTGSTAPERLVNHDGPVYGMGGGDTLAGKDVSYRYAPVAVTVDADDLANAGVPGDEDTILWADEVTGSSFDDTLLGPSSADAPPAARFDMSGGPGNDLIDARAAGGSISGDAGDDTLHGSAARGTTVDGGTGADVLEPRSTSVTVRGGEGAVNTWVVSRLGHGTELFARGQDTLDLSGLDTPATLQLWYSGLERGVGADLWPFYEGRPMTKLNGFARIVGTAHDDVIAGGAVLEGGDGDDVMVHSRSVTSIDGGAGRDALVSSGCPEVSLAAAQMSCYTRTVPLQVEDVLWCPSCEVTGDAGDNELHGRVVQGGPGADVLVGDTVTYADSPEGVTVTVGDGIANDGVPGENDLVGGPDAPTRRVIGSSHDDTMSIHDDVALDDAGDDRLAAQAGPGRLEGGEGRDQLRLRGRTGVADGGPGYDRAFFAGGGSTANVLMVEELDTWPTYAPKGHARIAGIERVAGTSGGDRFVPRMNSGRIDAGGGNDRVLAPEGSGRRLFVFLGSGNDRAWVGGDPDNDQTVYGGPGRDRVTYGGHESSPALICLDGRDRVCPTYDGRKGEHDRIGPDVEIVDGTNAADVLVGSWRSNRLRGLGGNDTFVGGGGADRFEGGSGLDAVVYHSPIERRGVVVTIDNRRNDGSPRIDDVRTDVEAVVGSLARDVMVGSDGPDILVSLHGNDVVNGGNGNDVINAGLGNDRLIGGAHADTLIGGAGNDVIYARDGRRWRDVVVCGPGYDVVVADRTDRILPGCERVLVR